MREYLKQKEVLCLKVSVVGYTWQVKADTPALGCIWVKGKLLSTFEFTLKKENLVLLQKRYVSGKNVAVPSSNCSLGETFDACFVATMEDISAQLISDLENVFFEKKLYLREEGLY